MMPPRIFQLALLALATCRGASFPSAAAEPDSRDYDINGIRIRCIVVGQGEPVLLIHGLHASATLNWNLNGVIAELAKDHRVIAPDLPGHGRSDKPEQETAYGVQVVKDMVELLDQLKVERAHLVGYSLGGMIAIKLMADNPRRTRSGLIGGMGWFRQGSGLQRFWDRLPAREGSQTPAAFTRTIGQLAVSEAELKSIDVPVEVLIGDRDPVRRLYVLPLEQARPDWPVVEIKDAGHVNCIVQPQFREQIARWIRKQSEK